MVDFAFKNCAERRKRKRRRRRRKKEKVEDEEDEEDEDYVFATNASPSIPALTVAVDRCRSV